MPGQICQQITGWVMQLDFDGTLQLIGVLATVTGGGWGIINYLQNRQEQHKREVETKIEALYARLEADNRRTDGRINDVKDTYVKRADLDREFANLQKHMSDMKQDFHNALVGVNARMDQMLALISKWTSNDPHR